MFIYAHRRRLYTAKYYLHRCTFNYLARIIVERLADTRFIDRGSTMCVCACVYVYALHERMNVALGKFERIMEYVDIVLCIRKICRVQMEDLALGGLYDVRVHGEEILLVNFWVKWVLFLIGRSLVFFFFFINVLEFFKNFLKPKRIGNKDKNERFRISCLRRIRRNFETSFVEFVDC